MRLNKYIAAAGICSRRKADELIANGNVKVNGAVVHQMGVDVGEDDVVMVNGKVLEHKPQKKVYVAVNKPLGTPSMDLRQISRGLEKAVEAVIICGRDTVVPMGTTH